MCLRRFIGRILQKFHGEIQRRLDIEADLKRRLGQAQRQLTANARKFQQETQQTQAELKKQEDIIKQLNYSLNEKQVELQDLHRHGVGGRGRWRTRGHSASRATFRKTHSEVGVKVLSVKDLQLQTAH